VKAVVDPTSWDSSAQMEDFDQKLIITALPETHRKLIDLLNQIRAVQALEIGLEVRVLTITTEWFEQIGIDFDMYFNTNTGMYAAAQEADPNMSLRDFFFQRNATPGGFKAGQLKNPVVFGGIGGSNVTNTNQTATGAATGGTTTPPDATTVYTMGNVGTPIGVRPQGATYTGAQGGTYTSNGWGPVGVQQDGLPLASEAAEGTITSLLGKAALVNPAFTVGMTFLDDVQVDLLVQATQADQRNAILTAPRLTLLNGQQSAISIGKVLNYISGYTQGTGNSTGVPITSQFVSGISMTIEAVASADRRYVTMTVYFQSQDFEKFDTVPVQQAVAGGGTGGGGAAVATNQIQLPQYRQANINTSVSVPDKGTVMLGGQKFSTDYEVEVGVPVLSKVPIVNRFFTNRVNSKTENNLLLLIRPEIMIQREAEDKLFPGLLGDRDMAAGDSQIR
jgi:type II secretory pathway component GspD/PulD (secretin)